MSQLFIRRPVTTILLAIGLALAGLFAVGLLPVASLPQVDYPTISVSAQLPGASPQTMADTVATPLIKQFQTIPAVDAITASSSTGRTQIVLQFNLDRNIDAAAADVQSAIAGVARRLPDNVTPPTYRKVNPADAPILLIAVHSPTMSTTDVDALAENVVAPSLSTIDGVAEAQVFGSQTYAVRVDVDPQKLAARGLSLDQVANAIAAANSQSPLGTFQTADQSFIINAPTQVTNAAGFASLIIATSNGNPVRLGQVATVYDSVENLQTGSWFDGKQAIAIAVMRQPGANTVGVIDAIKAKLPGLRAAMPASVSLDVTNDASTTILAAVHDVEGTLAVVVGLVLLVIYLFLNRPLATAIPGLAVPLSLLAAFAGMYVFGFSIDNMSLLALTLAVGLVVDDAIVVFENIIRHVEAGEKPFEAAIVGSREVAWTVVSMSLSLIAIFIPILLMGGVIGRLFNEFGVVVVMAIAASAFVSLTITPMLAARLPQSRTGGGRMGRWFSGGFARLTAAYGRSVGWCLNHQALIMLVFVGSLVGSYALFQISATTFFPPEDIGQLSISTQARQDISYADMVKLQQEAADKVQASPAVARVTSSVGGFGGGTLSSGQMFVQLKPKDQRAALDQVLAQLRQSLAGIPGLRSFIVPAQSLRFGGRSARAQYQLSVQSLDPAKVGEWSDKLVAAMQARPDVFTDVNTDVENQALQAQLTIDRDRANALGVTASAIRSTLNAGFGQNSVASIQVGSGVYDVILEYSPSIVWSDALLATIEVPAGNGAMVPLSSFAKVTHTLGPVTVNQTGILDSTTISFNLPSGVALGTATAAIATLVRQLGFPADVFTSYGGTAQVFAQSIGDEGLLIVAAIATIYVVLGSLYESFLHPLTILSGLPSATLGALLALKLFGFDLSVIAMIGILMLIGIVKKNAIMMIDVALAIQREDRLPALQAIAEAATRRFRPILMTTMCALLGTLPIALGTGASSELRQPLGVAVVGGLISSQLLTLFITPVIFVQIDRLRNWGWSLAFARRPRKAAPSQGPIQMPAE